MCHRTQIVEWTGECKTYLGNYCALYVNKKKYTFKEPKELHELYIEEVIKPKIFHSVIYTDFCESKNRNIWANACESILTNLRKNEGFTEVYLDYISFTPFNALFMCKTRTVKLVSVHLKSYEPMLKDVKLNGETKIEQDMAICYARRMVVPENIPTKKDLLYIHIAIFPLPTRNVVIFQHINENNYGLLDFERLPRIRNKLIPDSLYKQQPPTSYKRKVNMNFATYPHNWMNIVYLSDVIMFTNLCWMALRRSEYPNFIVDCLLLSQMKPNGRVVKVHNVEADSYNLFEVKVHHCPGFEVGKWLFINKTKYALSQGPNQNSEVVLEEIEHTDSMTYAPVEMIKNVYPEFLRKIEICN